MTLKGQTEVHGDRNGFRTVKKLVSVITLGLQDPLMTKFCNAKNWDQCKCIYVKTINHIGKQIICICSING